MRAEISEQLMGPFAEWITLDRSMFTWRGGHGIRSRPAWVALFICLATKAVHIEVVSDYSTSAFLAAFDRFCSRRNKPLKMHSDKGTNFQEADKELCRPFRELSSDLDIFIRLVDDEIPWEFIPPAAPHFGGLWEAAVKSLRISIILFEHWALILIHLRKLQLCYAVLKLA